MHKHHFERHYSKRTGWLRAVVLGANDGIVSTASLVVGVAAANADRADLLIAAIAGLVAGAMSMAAGEYVSVCSQADSQRADLEREKHELESNEIAEHEELTNIYIGRGLDKELAGRVAEQLMEHDALAAHARDELGLSDMQMARPMQAAFASAISFILGAALPVMLVTAAPMNSMVLIVSVCSLLSLSVLGSIAARIGGANLIKGAVRVSFWGALAMGATAAIGTILGTIV